MSNVANSVRALLAGMLMTNMIAGAAWGDDDAKTNQNKELQSVLDKLPADMRQKISSVIDEIRAETKTKVAETERQWRAQAEKMLEYGRKVAVETEKKAIEQIENEKAATRYIQGQLDQLKKEVQLLGKSSAAGKQQASGVQLSTTVDFTEIELSKLSPESREEIEKSRKQLKEAQSRFSKATEDLIRLEGRALNRAIVTGQPIQPATAATNVKNQHKLVQGQLAIINKDSPISTPSVVVGNPVPPTASPANSMFNPNFEQRLSKAEKALDRILIELKKLREEEAVDVKGEKKSSQKPDAAK